MEEPSNKIDVVTKALNGDLDAARDYLNKFPHDERGHWLMILMIATNFVVHVIILLLLIIFIFIKVSKQ